MMSTEYRIMQYDHILHRPRPLSGPMTNKADVATFYQILAGSPTARDIYVEGRVVSPWNRVDPPAAVSWPPPALPAPPAPTPVLEGA